MVERDGIAAEHGRCLNANACTHVDLYVPYSGNDGVGRGPLTI